MVLDSRYTYDLGVAFKGDDNLVPGAVTSTSKATLSLSSTGDIQFVSGKNNLVVHLARKMMNSTVNIPLNMPEVSTNQLKTLVMLILRNYKQTQVDELDAVDTNFVGYTIYRKGGPISYTGDTSDSFVKITNHAVTWKYADTSLENGFQYQYGLSKMYKNGVESAVVEQIFITPSAFLNNQKAVIGTDLVAVPGDKSITFYVNTNRLYHQSELLDVIDDIMINRDVNEPRRYIVDVTIHTVLGEMISLANGRQKVT